MARIPLTRGYYTEVDEQDVLWLINMCSWCFLDAGTYGYAVGQINNERIYMHIVIGRRMGLKGRVDHYDTNSLNNIRENLREANGSQNSGNRGVIRSNTGFKGVSWSVYNKKFKAFIGINGSKITLGYRDTAEEAHELYKEAVIKYFGEYANFGSRKIPIFRNINPPKPGNNLIILTPEEEAVELIPSVNNTGYRGIEYKPRQYRYRVEVTKQGDRHFGGLHKDINEAIKAWKKLYYNLYKR